jgi:hypothetical protein
VVDSLLEAKRWDAGEKKEPELASPEPVPSPIKLKRYFCDD